jgi:hypothetical protein
MAITIIQAPSPLQPAYNELNYLVTSSNKAQTNFRYVCDIYINNVYADRLTAPPHPTYGTATFNTARIIENYVNRDIDLTTYGFGTNDNSYINYVLKFGESYGSLSTGSVVYPNQTITGTKYVWNAIYDYPDFVDYSSGTIQASSSASRFLTNRPSSGDIQFTESYYLYANTITSGSTGIDYAYIVTKDSSNSTINTVKVNNQYKAFPTQGSRFLRFASGPNNINQIPASQITLGAQPIINSTDYAYTIQFFNSSNVAVSEQHRFTIASTCTKYTPYRLWFFNKLGGYDAFTFYRKSTFTSDIKRESFKSNLGVTAQNTFTYTKQQRATTNYSTKIKDVITLDSDWVSEAQLVWLEELISSPDAYIETAGSLIPINILTATNERKLVVNKKLFNLKVDFNYSYERQRQRF